MVFVPRGEKLRNIAQYTGKSSVSDTAPNPKNNPASTSMSNESMQNLIEMITESVRDQLLQRGVPLAQNQHSDSEPSFKTMLNQGADRIGHAGDAPFQPEVLGEDTELAKKIDHTLLKPDTTEEEVVRVCEEAKKYKFATVCLNSSFIAIASKILEGSGVKPIAVVGFPLGAAASATKAFETREAIKNGAQEIDMVINIGRLKSKDYLAVLEDIIAVVEAAKPYPVKVILETSNLNYDEKVIGCALSKSAGAAFVKTSTGFGSGGATAEDIELMRRVVGPEMGVKASGGIRTYEDAEKMIKAGASRIGASASVSIVTHKSEPKKPNLTGKKPVKTSLY